MAFDRSNVDDLLALKNELVNDPLSLGYAAASTTGILDLLNNPAKNTGGESGADFLTPEKVLSAIWGESISSQDQFKVDLLFGSVANKDSDISNFKSKLAALSTGINTALGTITRPLSRAEVLFSSVDANGVNESVTISRDDYIAARES